MPQAAGRERYELGEIPEVTGNSKMKKDLRWWGEKAEETAAELW